MKQTIKVYVAVSEDVCSRCMHEDEDEYNDFLGVFGSKKEAMECLTENRLYPNHGDTHAKIRERYVTINKAEMEKELDKLKGENQ